ncbi:MAG: DUF1697 domain-containing protein [Candidatus Nanopelagicales bacterium]
MSQRNVALLRGVNVGGNARVPMAALRESVQACGNTEVRTYINSGNVLFTDPARRSATELRRSLGERLAADFGFPISVVVLPAARFAAVAAAIPLHWANDTEAKADVVFLLPELDGPDALRHFPRKTFDEVIQVPGALLWRVSRADQSSTGLLDIIGTDVYRQVTVRNVNTVRKLAAMLG